MALGLLCDDAADAATAAATSGLSMLGFESVGDAVTPSSEPGLLLRLTDSRILFGGAAVLHTESSERDRMNRDTLPVPDRAASMSVPTRSNIENKNKSISNPGPPHNTQT